MKEKFNWFQFLVYIIVAVGLLFLTRSLGMSRNGSLAMSAGIFIILLLVERLLIIWERKQQIDYGDDSDDEEEK